MRSRIAFALAAAIAAATTPIYADEPTTSPAQLIVNPPGTQLNSNPATSQAAPLTTTEATTQPTTQPTALKKVVVKSDLDLARVNIAPALGAVEYTIGQNQIQNIPGGDNAPFQQVLLRAPGVVLDSFGQEHVRGEHGNLTYRINGVLLPEPLAGFAQELDTRLMQSTTLITGSLPAQFGFHTAGIVDVTTKSGASLKSNELSLYGGSHDTIQPAFQLGGSDGRFDWFVTGSFLHNDLGIENPTPSHRALHDYTNQEKFFGYFAYQLDDTSRLSLLISASNAEFQIPNTAGLAPVFPLAGGPTSPDSSKINENQHEQNYYTVLAYQKSIGDFNFQLAAFTRYGAIDFRPDVTNDLIFQGVAGRVSNDFVANGIQFDASYALNDQHTLRGGFIADYTCEQLRTNTSVFPTDSSGNPTSDVPFAITDNTRNGALEAGLYLQDEFKVTEKLTLNFGARYDRFDANFDHEGQFSPRINAVYKLTDKTALHAGYARYFVPPPVKQLGMGSITKFANTTNAPENFMASPPQVERSNYFDAGISHQITKNWQFTLDAFYKRAKNLIDEGQFGAPVVLSAFNYHRGTVYGAEAGTTFKEGGLSLYGNFSYVECYGRDIDSQQFLIANDELAYIATHDIHLDHQSEFTVSSGASYSWKNDSIYLDFLMGTGLRKGFANTEHLSAYYPINIGYAHIFRIDNKQTVTWRFDVVNVLDEKYEIRDGSGIGVGAPQFGQRIGFFTGLSYRF